MRLQDDQTLRIKSLHRCSRDLFVVIFQDIVDGKKANEASITRVNMIFSEELFSEQKSCRS
jgi:hypothetical protein